LEISKIVFQRRTDAAERAICSADCLTMMQEALNEVCTKYNLITYTKLIQSAPQANELYKNSSILLNQRYLYFDFRNIEEKHNAFTSMQFFNRTLTMFGAYKEQDEQLIQIGAKIIVKKLMSFPKT